MPDAAVRAPACRARPTSLVYRRRPLRRPTRVGAKDGARPAILIEGDGEDGYAERGGCRGARSRPGARATARADPGRLLHARREHADDAPAQYVSAYRGRRADPFERKYFAYLFRWARLLDRREWPKRWDGRSFGSLTQEERTPLIGPPPWLPRDLLRPPSGEPAMSEYCFDMAWREFSHRARAQQGNRAGIRYYAEKHMDTRKLDLAELPPVKVIVLLRDPRDTYISIRAFDRKRDRMRWIHDLLRSDEVPARGWSRDATSARRS